MTYTVSFRTGKKREYRASGFEKKVIRTLRSASSPVERTLAPCLKRSTSIDQHIFAIHLSPSQLTSEEDMPVVYSTVQGIDDWSPSRPALHATNYFPLHLVDYDTR